MDVLERFQSTIAAGDTLDWPQLCRELDTAHAATQSVEVRERLLALFCTMMDMVERVEISAAALATFRTGRGHHYQRLLLREAGPAGRPDRKALLDITAREVLCGRMAPEDALGLMANVSAVRPASLIAIVPTRVSQPQSHIVVGRWRLVLNALAQLLNRRRALPGSATLRGSSSSVPAKLSGGSSA